jgi:1-deoxy-D-xylulose-5-phosphate synthase
MHPVVAVYSTFLTRAMDQVLLDVALHRCGVTFVLDRAGVTGEDGPSHNGMWDLSLLGVVPTLRLAAPRDGTRLRELLREAVAVDDAPTVVRFPKGALPDDIAAAGRVGCADVILREGSRDVLVIGVGAMVRTCVEVCEKLQAEGYGVTLVDPRWVRPVEDALVALAARHRLVVTVEDNVRAGGVGSAVAQALADAHVGTPVRIHAIPQRFLDHDSRDAVLAEVGLTGDVIAQDTVDTLCRGGETGSTL